MFSVFKRKCPECGMPEIKGKGIIKHDKWFCSEECLQKYEEGTKQEHEKCCH